MSGARDSRPMARRRLLTGAAGGLAAGALAAPLTAGQSDRDVPMIPDGQLSPAGSTVLGAGVHRLPGSMTVRGGLLLLPGAQIEIARGRTLRLEGAFQAPMARVFTGEGTVDLNGAAISHACPEWWGAAPDDPQVDCLPALTACLAAHPVMHLRAAEYHISDTLVVERPYARIEGVASRGYSAGQGTRLVLADAHGAVLRVGPQAQPASVNDFLWETEIAHLNLARSVAPAAGSVGLSARFLLYCRFERVSAFEHSTCFHLSALVRSHLIDCFAFRSAPGSDVWRGFHCDGTRSFGLAGGNASLFLTDCLASTGGGPGVSDPVGFLLDHAFADTFLTRPETAACATGIRVEGRASRLGGRMRSGHANLHIAGAIVDQCGTGIEVVETSRWALIEIVDPYVGLGPAADCAIRFDRQQGQAGIVGGQVLGWVDAGSGGNALGLHATGCSALTVSGLKLLDCMRPLSLDTCDTLDIAVSIANPGHPASQAAVWMKDCVSASVRPVITGRASAFPHGVEVTGARSERVTLDLAAVDRSAIARGEAALVFRNDSPAQAVRIAP